MSQETTVRKLAQLVNTPVEELLEQLAEAGMRFDGPDQVVTSTEKMKLLGFLKRSHGKAEKFAEQMAAPRDSQGRWRPSKFRSWLFKNDDWSFVSDGDTFTLSARGRPPIEGPLLLIHSFVYRRKNAFPASSECRFVVAVERAELTELTLGGLKPDQSEDIKRFLDEHMASSLAECGLRARRGLNEWKVKLDRRLQSGGFIESETMDRLKEAIPLPATAGIGRWSVLFDHPQLAMARGRFGASFPDLGISPDAYLEDAVERHNREVFTIALARWASGLRSQLADCGWVGRRAEVRMLDGDGAPPTWPGKTWRDVAPVEFQPSPTSWLNALVQEHNAAFEDRQLLAKRTFFDSVESNPLTEEQARAVVCMDDELLVVAAAGSGKSSTIVAKAGYALDEGLCAPEDILLLAFNADAAEELRDRIAKRLGTLDGAERIKAKTFHAFGLEVIGAATGKMPTPAPWLDQGQDVTFIGHLVDELCAESETFAEEWALFRMLYFKGVGRWDEQDEPEDYDPDSPRRRGFRTLQGEIVKSKSERLIADWLFLHGVHYVYEAPYAHDTSTAKKRQYRPDFYYPDIGVYHEHLALDANGNPPESFKGYLEGVAWKRRTHQEHGTTLFETTAHELRTGHALRSLKRMLKEHGIEPVFNPNRDVPGREPISPQAIAQVLRVFQQHMKSSQQTIEQAYARVKQTPDAFVPRLDRFLSIYEDVARKWEERLAAEGLVDFEDMLNQSAALIEAGRCPCATKMILADEFQDSSRARMRLIQAVVDASGAQFTAVGDDWQGIYRFAGADISLMSGFQKRFPHAAVRQLSQTFRCPQDLCDLTSAFVAKNPMQIPKGVRTHNPRSGPSIKVYALPDEESIAGRLRGQLEALHKRLPDVDDPQKRPTVLLLGRYRRDKPAELAAWREGLGDRLVVRFLTVHRSKGLEADWVVLLNVVQGTLGFPSQVEDDPILQLAMPEPENFPYAEERRLFYVALTRAKRSVVVYTTQPQPSEFLVELQAGHNVPMINVEGEPRSPCPVCSKGVIVERVNTKTREVFNSCSRFPRCDGKTQMRPQHADGEIGRQSNSRSLSR